MAGVNTRMARLNQRTRRSELLSAFTESILEREMYVSGELVWGFKESRRRNKGTTKMETEHTHRGHIRLMTGEHPELPHSPTIRDTSNVRPWEPSHVLIRDAADVYAT